MSIHQRFKGALQALGIVPDVKAALALSGGPDSLALAILTSRWLSRGDFPAAIGTAVGACDPLYIADESASQPMTDALLQSGTPAILLSRHLNGTPWLLTMVSEQTQVPNLTEHCSKHMSWDSSQFSSR